MADDSTPTTQESPTPPVGARRPVRIWLAVLIVAATICGGWAVSRIDWTPTSTLFTQARNALQIEDFEAAERLGHRLMNRPERFAEGVLITAEAASKLGRFADSVRILNLLPRANKKLFVAGKLFAAGIQADELGSVREAEISLREALSVEPDSIEANEKLSFVLGLSGRSWEATPYRLVLIQQPDFPLHHLTLLALGSTAAENPELIHSLAKKSTDDVIVKCGLARVALRDGQSEEAERLLVTITKHAPTLYAAQAWRADFLAERNDMAALQAWHAQLPAGADAFPDIWFVRGKWALLRAEPRAAARCFWECLKRDTHHQSACYQLANILAQLGDEKSAEVFREHSRLLNELISAAKTIEITGNLAFGKRAAEACDALGLRWEAPAWREIMRRHNPRQKDQTPPANEARPPEGTPRIDPQIDPTVRVNLAAFPLPVWPTNDSSQLQPGSRPSTATSSSIAFADLAQQSGMVFTYRNGSRPETDSEYMYEFSGGGVGVLDFDLDGWPDFYFTQAADSPPGKSQGTHLDALFRNMGNGHFANVTPASTIREAGFGQGCAVGDFDNDGFPDLYVANIGPNRFFHNNGDGTFTDITQAAGVIDDRWTTSCAVADFNGDGLPDLFAANYLTGDTLFTQPCRMANGASRLCTPHEFQAAHDQILINLGDGRFEDQSERAGIEVPEGKGLGLVVASWDQSSRLSVFVANDAVPNFYFLNDTPSRGAPVHFGELALPQGLAVDAEGLPQACMGVASGDANGDGLLDLYVTNFRNESNTLYMQLPDGSFVDATRTSGLREPSFPMLGFGTQFLDADLDGWEDLAVTNGHVGNLKHHGVPYEMQPQFFRNLGEARFVELQPQTVGPFFAGKYLGRGMARVDWNRDGRDDVAISHLKSPIALLTNQTPDVGNHVAIHLRGTESDRDAIGSIVTVTAGGRKLVRHLTAGDGYQASNQRQLTFGLGKARQIEQLEVRWPTGITQVFSPPAINSAVLLIEDRLATVPIIKP